jgi:hypothetical protein
VAATWQDDPETLLWLKTLALSDGDSDVQIAAVEELGRSWQDDQQTLVGSKLSPCRMAIRLCDMQQCMS